MCMYDKTREEKRKRREEEDKREIYHREVQKEEEQESSFHDFFPDCLATRLVLLPSAIVAAAAIPS